MGILPGTHRAWPFLMPAALLPLMAGFSGHLNGWHALAMLLLGAAILPVWLQKETDPPTPAISLDQTDAVLEYSKGLPVAVSQDVQPPPRPMSSGKRATLVIIGIVLAAVGAYLAVQGCVQAAVGSPFVTPPVIATVILSPLLMLPTIGTATAVAHHGHVGRALSALVGTVLLNLCLLLPIVILLHSAMHIGAAPKDALATPGFLGRLTQFSFPPLPYPLATWRIDNVLLVLLGFAAMAVATGRWVLGRLEALLMVFGFMAYLAAQALVVMH
jgi:sodium/calcium exchanger protein